MKKFFKTITKKPSKEPAPPESPRLGAAAQPLPELGYDVREKELPKLHKAAWTGDIAKVKQYVKKDPSAHDKDNRTALHLACAQGHSTVVQELLEWHAKTNIGDNDSKTPLIKAVECNREECVMLLLEHRGDVDAVDRDGDSSLHIAVRNGYTNIVKVLLRNGATIDKKNKDGCTPLHLACRGKKPEIIRILLFDSKATVDVADINGRTPLMLASYEGSVTAVQLLLQCNANTMVKDQKGFSAEDIAMMTAQHGCCQLIRDHNMRLCRSANGGSSANTTPRSSMGLPTSASATPRDNITTPDFGLPLVQQQSDDESGDDDASKLSTGGDFDRSWGDDTDMSLSMGDRRGKDDWDLEADLLDEWDKEMPKINLAQALTKSVEMGDEGGGEGSAHLEASPRAPVSKQDSNKSLQSQTSIEDNWSDEEEEAQSRKSNTSRVTWKEGHQLSETKEISDRDDAETTDDDDYKVMSKRPKLDSQGDGYGYTPTGISDIPKFPVTPEQHKEAEELRDSKNAAHEGQSDALMDELGLSDADSEEDEEFHSEVSDPLSGVGDAPIPPTQTTTVEDEDPDSQANSDHVTPRPGILKNWKQHSKEQMEQNKSPGHSRSEDVSEWDSDLENELDPEKSLSGNEEELDNQGRPHQTRDHTQASDGQVAEGQDSDYGEQDGVLGVSEDGILIGDLDSSQDNPEVEAGGTGSGRSPVGEEHEEEEEHEKRTVMDMVHVAGEDFDDDDLMDREVARVLAVEELSDSSHIWSSRVESRILQLNRSSSQDTLDMLRSDGEEEEVAEEEDKIAEEEGKIADEDQIAEEDKLAEEEDKIAEEKGQIADEDQIAEEKDKIAEENEIAEDEDQDQIADEDEIAEDEDQIAHEDEIVEEDQIADEDETGDDEGSNWDSSADITTPRNPVIAQTVASYLPHDDDDDVEEVDFVQEVPLETVNAAIQEAAAMDAVSVGTVDSNQSAGTSGSKQETVRETLQKTGQDMTKEDNDSEWDSEEEVVSDEEGVQPQMYRSPEPLPNMGGAPAAQGSPRGQDSEDEETISEWEIERQREKEERRRLEEEEERMKEEELRRQDRWEEEETRRQEQLKREAEEEEFEMRLAEEEEARRLQEEEEALQEAEEAGYTAREVEHGQIDLFQLKQMRLKQEAEKTNQGYVQGMSSDEDLTDLTDQDRPVPVVTSPRREMKTVNFLSVKKFFNDEKKDIPPSPPLSASMRASTPQGLSSSQHQSVEENKTGRVEEDKKEVKEEIMVQAEKSSSLHHPLTPPAHSEGPGAIRRPEITSHVSPPQFSTTVAAPIRSVALPQHVPTTRHTSSIPTRHKMSLQSDGNSMDDEDSDLEQDRSDMGTYLKNLPSSYGYAPYKGLDDDVLSFTSTENGESSVYAANLPYGKDVLASMNLSDPNTVIKLQDHLRDQRKMLDHERNQRLTLESKHKSLSKERNEMQKKIDTLNQQRTSLEQAKLDLEQRIRNLEYNLNEEVEMRKNADILLSKTKEQLSRKEEQYTSEMEARQKAELQIRNLQMEIRSTTSAMKQLDDEKETLARQYQHEKNARQLQEQVNDEQQKLQRQLHTEQVKSATQKTDAENRFEVADEDRKYTHDHLDKARAELNAMKRELDRQRSRFKDENALLSSENEELQIKIEELKNEIKLNEDALAHATVQYNLQISNSRSEIGVLNGVVDRERLVRERGEAELESANNRLHAAAMELEKADRGRNEMERRYQDDKEKWTQTQEDRQREMNILQESHNNILRRSQAIEAKLLSTENEHHITSATLMEKSNLLSQAQKDLQYYKSAQDSYDQNYKVEKEHNIKLTIKIENLQEKNTTLQHDNLSLKQQLETMQQVLADKAADNGQERFNTLLTTLKTEQDKARVSLEEKNSSLMDASSRLREEVRNSEARRTQLEQELSRLNRDYNDLIRKLSVAEASLEMAQKAKESLEQERGQLKLEVDKLHQKYEMAHEKSVESQARITEMVDRLERSEQNNLFHSQQLMNNSANIEAYSRTKEELEDSFQKMQVDNVKLQAELNHEKQRAEMLQKDLQDSQRVRSSLEELCSNLKSAKAQLEDKLGHEQGVDVESTTRTMMTQEAESNKELWELEVVSRSKLGLRVVQYEKQKQEALAQLEEEKRRCRKALELKKSAENKYEAEHEKTVQLHTEIASLKTYLKAAKKRLKDPLDDTVDNSEVRINTLHSGFDQERLVMEGTLSTVRRQLNELQNQVEEDVEGKSKLQARNLQLQSELGAVKRLQKTVEKLEHNKVKLEQEYTTYKSRVENGYVDKEELDQLRKEMEAHYRLELNRKLDEVNSYLEEQARSRDKLDNSRDESDLKLKGINRKLQDETSQLRIKFEQVLAQKESKEMEAKRFRDLYESEMQWRMRLNEQLMKSTDRAFTYKTNAERQKSRMFNNNVGNMSFSGTLNGQLLDSTRFSGAGEDILGNRLRAELDRSIAKHLEAGPHDNIRPLLTTAEDHVVSSSFAKSNADYLELLKRKHYV